MHEHDIRAVFDAAGLPTGFYDATLDPPERIPPDAVAIDEAAWIALRAGGKRWDGGKVVDVPPAPPAPPAVPDNPTLSDWRVAVTLWGRMDDVTGKVAALGASSDPAQAMLGKIAKERLEYANNVLRAQLLQLKDALGFSEADCDESLWRAHQVSLGDLSGKWPV